MPVSKIPARTPSPNVPMSAGSVVPSQIPGAPIQVGPASVSGCSIVTGITCLTPANVLMSLASLGVISTDTPFKITS